MALRDNPAFAELTPYLAMTVAPNGVTVGDLNFVVAQTQWSTALFPIGTANTLAADVSVNLWQTAQSDTGAGFATALTRSQTSWQDSQGRLPANQVFIATSCAFQLFKRDIASTTATAQEVPIPSYGAVHAIARNLTWSWQVGDGIQRNYGALSDWGGMAGSWSIPGVAETPGFDINAVLADPDCRGRRLPLPLVFPPNISAKVTVANGSGFAVAQIEGGADPLPLGSFLAVRQYLHGYLCTMPVG